MINLFIFGGNVFFKEYFIDRVLKEILEYYFVKLIFE